MNKKYLLLNSLSKLCITYNIYKYKNANTVTKMEIDIKI